MIRLKALIAYDGTDFYGWQVQKDHPTIQSTLTAAIKQICGEEITVTGAGRTDTGVHAYGQVAHIDWEHDLPIDRLQFALNSVLPESIRIRTLEDAAPEFHARFDAKSKIYLYRIDRDRAYNPFLHRFALQYYSPLDEELMNQAARLLLGEHDFIAFSATGTDVVTTRRTVTRVELSPEVIEPFSDSRILSFRIEANGFLRKMVRFIVGTILEIGSGKRPIADLQRALEMGDKSGVGIPAAAKGLFLEKVFY